MIEIEETAFILKIPTKITKPNHIAFIHAILAAPPLGQASMSGRAEARPSDHTIATRLPATISKYLATKDRAGRVMRNNATLRRHGRQKENS